MNILFRQFEMCRPGYLNSKRRGVNWIAKYYGNIDIKIQLTSAGIIDQFNLRFFQSYLKQLSHFKSPFAKQISLKQAADVRVNHFHVAILKKKS